MTAVKLFSRLGVALVLIHSLISPNASAQSQLTYTTSWIGNSFGFGDGKWMQQDIQAISVGVDGTVYTNSPWDESGSEIAAYRAGDKLAVAGSTHGWGAAGGDAVATNHTYLYAAMSIGNESNALVGADYPPANQTWFGITRRTLANLAAGAPFSGGIGNSANATKNSFLRSKPRRPAPTRAFAVSPRPTANSTWPIPTATGSSSRRAVDAAVALVERRVALPHRDRHRLDVVGHQRSSGQVT